LPHSRSPLINLTAVVQPQIVMAQASFKILEQRLNQPGRAYQTVIVDYELAVGRTCGCLEANDGATVTAVAGPNSRKA
jgi:DNA-binding LacI/PurR family transcriptional regulator